MNLKMVCRTCLRVPKSPKALFEEQEQLLEKIETISNVKIEANPELPQHICEECFKQINRFYSFRKVIISTNYDLLSRLETLQQKNYVVKPRSIEVNRDNDIQSQCGLEIKSEEASLSAAEEIEIDHDYAVAEDNLVMLRALAMKKIFQCKQCKEVFNSRIMLLRHKRTNHTLPRVCNICGSMIRADNISKHIKMHSEQQVKCDICGRMFKNSESLRTHKFLHSNNVYTCEICEKCFKIKSEHTRHMKKHKDPDFRKVACNLCGKKVYEIKKHMQTHTGEKPFMCTICNRGFCSRYAVKIHKRQHTNEKPFICDYCGLAFPQKVSLVSHLKSKHGIE